MPRLKAYIDGRMACRRLLLVMLVVVGAVVATNPQAPPRPAAADDTAVTTRCYRHALDVDVLLAQNVLLNQPGQYVVRFPLAGRADEVNYARSLLLVRIEQLVWAPLGAGADQCTKVLNNRTYVMPHDQLYAYWVSGTDPAPMLAYQTFAQLPVPCAMQGVQQYGLAADSPLDWGARPVLQQSGMIYAAHGGAMPMEALYADHDMVAAPGQELYFALGLRYQSGTDYALQQLVVQKCISILDVVDPLLVQQLQEATVRMQTSTSAWTYAGLPTTALAFADPLLLGGYAGTAVQSASGARVPVLAQGQYELPLVPLRSSTEYLNDNTCGVWLGYYLAGDAAVSLPAGPYNRFTPKDVERSFPPPTLFQPGMHPNVLHVRWICTQPVGGMFIPFAWTLNTKQIAVVDNMQTVDVAGAIAAALARVRKGAAVSPLRPQDLSEAEPLVGAMLVRVRQGAVAAEGKQTTIKTEFIIVALVVAVVFIVSYFWFSALAAYVLSALVILLVVGVISTSWFERNPNYEAPGQVPLDSQTADLESKYGIKAPVLPTTRKRSLEEPPAAVVDDHNDDAWELPVVAWAEPPAHKRRPI